MRLHISPSVSCGYDRLVKLAFWPEGDAHAV
jgi:hypothetical protein